MADIPGAYLEELTSTGFKVHELGISNALPASRGRRDFYKMGLINGCMTIDNGEKAVTLFSCDERFHVSEKFSSGTASPKLRLQSFNLHLYQQKPVKQKTLRN